MRNIGFIILGILWLLIGYKMCTDQERCCNTADAVIEQPTPAAPAVVAKKECPRRSICFDANDCQAYYGEDFEGLRDSLAALLTEGKRLLITGIYSTDETYSGEYQNLGICRAETVKQRLLSAIGADKIDISSEQSVGVALTPPDKIRFGVSTVVRNDIPESTQIYFPFNSTNKLDDNNVETYLDKVAERVISSGEKVRLTGHTDDIGSDSSNLVLGRRRAQVVKDYLVSKGVKSAQVTVDTAGEAQPVASNDTDSGRAKNRRTELQIIK